MKRYMRFLSAALCLMLLLSAILLPAGAVKTYNELPIVPPHEHTWDAGTVTTAPTCTTTGVKTYTCSCGASYTEAIPATGHSYTYTNNGNDTHTVGCSKCSYSATESHAYTNGTCVCGATQSVQQPAILSASPRIGEDVSMVYTALIPTGYTSPYMIFTFNGKDYRVYGSNVENERCTFSFDGVTPEKMGDNICAVLHTTHNGADVTATIAEYSVRQYCVNRLANNPSEKLKVLLSDLLTYGAAAQQYVGYKTNDLVTKDLNLTPSAFPGLTGKTVTFSGTANSETDWTGATLVLRSTLAVRFYFRSDNANGFVVRCTLNGRTTTFTDEDFCQESGAGNVYYVELSGVDATAFDQTVTGAFYSNNEPFGRSASYSVNAYICSMQNCADANLQRLVRALYNYGASAENYVK